MTEVSMIETRGLTKTFGRFTAVNALDLHVRQGSVHGFIGPNGAGKTTTMKMLVGAIRSTDGDGNIKGHPIGSIEARRLIGYSPERPPVYCDMTSMEYLEYLGGLDGLKSAEARTRASEVLDSLELVDFARMKIGNFSAGMKQRLSLAQTLVHDPELLILDEPTANLDPGGRIWVVDKLRQLARDRGVTVLISSHILSELEQLVDSVSLIDKGRLVAESTIDELKGNRVQDRYIIDTSDNQSASKIIGGKSYIHDVWVDDMGILHVLSDDMASLQKDLVPELIQKDILIKTFVEDKVHLEDLYRHTIGLDKD